MSMIRTSTAAAALVLLAACGGAGDSSDTSASEETAPVETASAPEFLAEVSSANYSLENTHAFLTFEVGHSGGLSSYRVTFTDWDADLKFNAVSPETSELSVTINPLGLETNYPGDYAATHADSEFESWEQDLARNARWLNADAHPKITFQSTAAEMTGDKTGKVTGDLSFLGQTKPVTLDVTYNGNGNQPWYGERDIIGFNATTVITRSDFGMDAYLPMIGDEVTVEFTGEFLQDE